MAHENHQNNRTHHLVLNGFVMHLLFDRTSINRVTGLVYEKNGFEFEVLATKGVILSAGKQTQKIDKFHNLKTISMRRHDRYTTNFAFFGNRTEKRTNQCDGTIP